MHENSGKSKPFVKNKADRNNHVLIQRGLGDGEAMGSLGRVSSSNLYTSEHAEFHSPLLIQISEHNDNYPDNYPVT